MSNVEKYLIACKHVLHYATHTHTHRTLMEGDSKTGFTVFWADDGLDTGPILLQRECNVEISDTVDSLYTRFLFPEGIRAMVCASVGRWMCV